MNRLDTIFKKYNTDKHSGHHNYLRQYAPILSKYEDKPIRMLEIGVAQGGSMKGWREYFWNAECIVGIDTFPGAKQFEEADKSVFVEICDASNRDLMQAINQKYGPFDFIIDDGSHYNMHVIQSFEILFPLLKDNGLYIVEDTNCYRSKGHQYPNMYIVDEKTFQADKYPRLPDQLQYFVQYVVPLNQSRLDSIEGTKDLCADPFKIIKKTNNILEAGIDKLEFGCSFIAIHKKLRTHWL